MRKGLLKKAYVRKPVSESTRGRAPKVSIVITCYNYEHFLPDSIGSALAQEGVEPEVIVVDDASTDDSAAVAQQFAEVDSRVTVLRRRQNGGPVLAFNEGCAAATGEFIVRLDADDLLTPGSLVRSIALFDAYPSVGLVYGHPRHFITMKPPEPHVGEARSWSIWSGMDWLSECCRRGCNMITTPEAVCRAKIVRQIGPMNPRLELAHDMEMWLRAAAVCDIGRVDGPDQALHRDHTASLSADTGHMRDIRARRDVFEIFFEDLGGQLPDANGLHETANRSLAAEALGEACRAYDRGRTQSVDVDGYIEFALQTYSEAKNLPDWRALERRRRIGSSLAPYMPFFFPAIVRRGLKSRLSYRRWTKTGLW
jgi:glycosyltransferase involved in cell wall biosynthesis